MAAEKALAAVKVKRSAGGKACGGKAATSAQGSNTKTAKYDEWVKLKRDAKGGDGASKLALSEFEKGKRWQQILSTCAACEGSFPGVDAYFSKKQLKAKACVRRCMACVANRIPVNDISQPKISDLF